MARVLADELEVCEDCAAIAANGALGWDTDPLLAMTKLHYRKMERHLGAEDADNLVLACGDEDEDTCPTFSTRPCDGCGSTLAGSRHLAAVLGNDEPEPHKGHYSRLGGQWFCDTCNSPYCELA